MGDFVGVPGGPAPCFFAGLGVMAGDAVAAYDEQHAFAVVGGDDRGGEGFEAFGDGVGGANDFPEVLAGGGVEGEDVGGHVFAGGAFGEALEVKGGVALKDLDVELAAVEQGAGAVGPLGAESAVGLGQVAIPEGIAVEIEGGEFGVGEQEDDALAIGGGGGVGHVAAVIPAEAIGDGFAPKLLAGVGVVAEADEFLL